MLAKSGDKNGRKIRRVERYREFRLFVGFAEEWFTNIVQSDDRHELLAEIYGFYILPGGRLGGVDNRMLEVFYGNRPIDHICEVQWHPKENSELSLPLPHRRFLTESGAALRYQRTDDGSVVCFLQPSRSENLRRPESEIILAVIREPRDLTGRPALERHWRALISYFECSSVDGNPSVTDRFRTWWLLFTRPVIIEKKVNGRRVLRVGGEILKWALTIGLSGALLEVVRLSSKAWTGG